MSPLRINLTTASFDCVGGHFLELWDDLLDEVAFNIYRVEIFLKVRI
jgi:hypothetical protein